MASALIIVTTELVSRPDDIKSVKSKYSDGYEIHQQLLERIETNAINLTPRSFDIVHIATVPGDKPVVLNSAISELLWTSLKPSGTVDGAIAPESKANLVVSGFVPTTATTYKKIDHTASVGVELKRKPGAPSKSLPKFQRIANATPLTPSNDDDLDDLIDEDSLVAEATPAIKFPAKCDPGPGRKRRRACKDCTCGLKELEEQEASDSRQKQNAVILNDLSEIDFTVPGKAVGGCGSCALGDAFRCDGCPYLGLPPFKPGEVVSIDRFGDDMSY